MITTRLVLYDEPEVHFIIETFGAAMVIKITMSR